MDDANLQSNPPARVIHPARYCRQCLYVLDGLPSPRCPECGTAFDPECPSTYLNGPRKPGHPWLYLGGALLSLPAMVFLFRWTGGAIFFAYPLVVALALPHHFRLLPPGTSRWPTYAMLSALCVLFSAQAAATILAWHTLGEMEEVFYFLFGLGNIVACVLWRFRQRLAAVVVAAILSLLTVPEQVHLGYRLHCLQEEVAAMAGYLESHAAAHGAYPADMSDYLYKRPWTSSFIECDFGSGAKGAYRILYWVKQRGVSHWYDRNSGWGYYPD